MSNQFLQKILNNVSKSVAAQVQNVEVYKYVVEYNKLLDEVYTQISSYFAQQNLEVPRESLAPAVNTYCTSIYKDHRYKNNDFTVTLAGTALSFIVMIQCEAGEAPKVLSYIDKIRDKALSNLQKSVSIILDGLAASKSEKKAVQMQDSKFSEGSDLNRGIIEFNHTQGKPISDGETIIPSVSLSSNIRKLTARGKKVSDTIIAKMSIDFWSNYGELKKGSIRIIFDDGTTPSVREQFRAAALKELRKIDWFTEPTPISAVDIVEGQLTSNLYKIGAKGGSKIRAQQSKQRHKFKAAKDIKRKTMTATITDSLSGTLKTGSTVIDSPEQKRNWASLIPIINRRLHDQLAKNMVYPRLVYRTGTFARSVRVLGVEETSRGYPSFVYDYQRSPYDVFDPYKGTQPWNTPARNPRSLIDMSIREILREMAIGRFYLRRA